MKKIISTLMALTIFIASACTALAAEPEVVDAHIISAVNDAQVISAVNENTVMPYFFSYTGRVVSVTRQENAAGNLVLQMESEEDGPAGAVISSETLVLGNADIKAGDTVTIYFESGRPMIMIYPPQYSADIAIVNPEEGQFSKADVFDSELLSRDGTLKLNIGDETEILSQDGKPFDGELADRKLLVFYTMTTFSLPPQTTPQRVIVLDGEPEPIESPDDGIIPRDVSSLELIVNGNAVDALPAFTTDDGVMMVPLRAIAEALGYKVSWDGATQTVTLNQAISLQIGRDYYVYMRMAPITLGTAPVLKDSRTFVPLIYFSKVLGVGTAGVTEDQIVIDNSK